MHDDAHFKSGTVLGDWRLNAFIGRGGNGEVYCAEHVRHGTSAAVKVLVRKDERAIARFDREAKLMSRLKSDSFPNFFAYGEADGYPYLAMELLEPGEPPTSDRAVAQFLLKICAAVKELHSHGLVHRDIKPANILYRNATEPVLADFGLIKEVSQSDGKISAAPGNQSISIVDGQRIGAGTIGYGAPEQMERGEATFASDIHAIGVLADHCFNGKPPYAWARIIQRATSSIPSHRYQSVAALSRAIRRRHWRVYALFGSFIIAALLAVGMALQKPAKQLWTYHQNLKKIPSLDASAVLDGQTAKDARWYLDNRPIAMPYQFVESNGGKRNRMPRQLCAVVQRDGKTYSAKRMDIVPEWIGRKEISLTLKEDPAEGTNIQIWGADGTPFEFVWCSPRKDEANGFGFWIAKKRLTGRQFGTFLKGCIRHTPISSTRRQDLSSDLPIQLEFDGPTTVPVVSFPNSGFSLEPPNILQWKRCMQLVDDRDDKAAEWAYVPPELKNGHRGGGWMKMDGSGQEAFIGSFLSYNKASIGTACVRYVATSWFRNETNSVLYCTAQSLLRSKAATEIARGKSMMKSFFTSDDMVLKTLAMECCIERGIMPLADFGTNAVPRLRLAAIRHGDVPTLERLATEDPDPVIREKAYARLSNPTQMVSARYIAQINHSSDRTTLDIAIPLKVIRSMTERSALDFIVRHSCLHIFRDEAQNRLESLDVKRK